MELLIGEIAQRIRTLRDICELSVEDMAEYIGCSVTDYELAETGKTDFSFTFIYKCAEKFGVDMVELLTGDNPHLSFYFGGQKRRRSSYEAPFGLQLFSSRIPF
jgi:transcriptional regulator with XRE-family HTH domain